MTNYRFSTTKPKTRLYLIMIILSIRSLTAFGQTLPVEFFKGLDLLNTDQKKAKQEFLTALRLDTLFHAKPRLLLAVPLLRT